MAQYVVEPPRIAADDLFRGLLAALAVLRHDSLSADQRTLHRAFRKVVQEAKDASERGVFALDLVDVDFNPLYGLSGWLDRALTRAQRDLLVSFPNPSYGRIKILYGEGEGKKVLQSFELTDEFLRLAKIFWDEINSAPARRSR